MKLLIYGSFILSAMFCYMGLNKMYVYENPESSLLEHKNVYVGGDAYNYIINSNLSAAFFILSLIFVVLGSLLVILRYLSSQSDTYKRVINLLEQNQVSLQNVRIEEDKAN